jgi:hypothetical protein
MAFSFAVHGDIARCPYRFPGEVFVFTDPESHRASSAQLKSAMSGADHPDWSPRERVDPPCFMYLVNIPSHERSLNPSVARGLILIVCLGMLIGMGPCLAGAEQRPKQDSVITFDIPEQPLDSALEAYMQTTGLQVLYRSTLTSSLTSNGVRGRLTAREALEMLLAGSNLAARYTVDGAFTITAIPSGEVTAVQNPPPRRVIIDYDAFLATIQDRIIASLCGNAVTRPGRYRAALQFSIEPSGTLDDLSLLDSTGNVTRDRLIPDLLQGLMIGEAPPATMPQPVTMLIVPRRPEFPDECPDRRLQPDSLHDGLN